MIMSRHQFKPPILAATLVALCCLVACSGLRQFVNVSTFFLVPEIAVIEISTIPTSSKNLIRFTGASPDSLNKYLARIEPALGVQFTYESDLSKSAELDDMQVIGILLAAAAIKDNVSVGADGNVIVRYFPCTIKTDVNWIVLDGKTGLSIHFKKLQHGNS